jgi:hypothetical protein
MMPPMAEMPVTKVASDKTSEVTFIQFLASAGFFGGA